MTSETSPGEERRKGRELVADALASVVPAWVADETEGEVDQWQELADNLLHELDEKGLLVVHETFLLALKNGVRNG